MKVIWTKVCKPCKKGDCDNCTGDCDCAKNGHPNKK